MCSEPGPSHNPGGRTLGCVVVPDLTDDFEYWNRINRVFQGKTRMKDMLPPSVPFGSAALSLVLGRGHPCTYRYALWQSSRRKKVPELRMEEARHSGATLPVTSDHPWTGLLTRASLPRQRHIPICLFTTTTNTFGQDG